MNLIEIKVIGLGLAFLGAIAVVSGNYQTAAYLFLLAFVYGVVSCAE